MDLTIMSQSSVDSLVGWLASLLVDEARLLGGVRGDVQFIKDEMESMHGFLLDVASAGEPVASNQVRAWRRQVEEVAFDSQNCIARYVQTFGAGRTSAGVLGSIARAPHLLRTLRTRHRIAAQIRDLKARAHDVGERRLRYGVEPPAAAAGTGRGGRQAGGDAGPGRRNEDAARRRRALANATAADWLDTDARAMMAWLAGTPGGGSSSSSSSSSSAPGLKEILGSLVHLAKDLASSKSFEDAAVQFLSEAMKMIGRLSGNQEAESLGEAYSILMEEQVGLLKAEVRLYRALVVQMVKGGGAKNKSAAPSASQEEKIIKEFQKDYGQDAMTLAKEATSLREMIRAEWLYMGQSLELLLQVILGGGVLEHLLGGRRRPRLLAIVTPPVEDEHHPHGGGGGGGGDDDDDDERGYKRGTELAKKVYDKAREAGLFECSAWVEAGRDSLRRQRLESILRQVGRPEKDDVTSTWDEQRLCGEIQKRLEGKKFLIVLADHEDPVPWSDIDPALPARCSAESVVIISPLIRQLFQFAGWYFMASPLFAIANRKSSHYRIHFYSHVGAVSRNARELLLAAGDDDLLPLVKHVLKKCRWDPYSTNMFLHALYANPRMSAREVQDLVHGLHESTPGINAGRMIRFAYDDLQSQHARCLLYLSNFPQGQEVRRTSLLRRWAAESLVARPDQAEATFDDLVARGLVRPAAGTMDTAGRAKKCTVDPRVLSFIRNRAGEENVANTDLLPDGWPHRLSIRSGIQPRQLAAGAGEGRETTTVACSSCWGRRQQQPQPEPQHRDAMVLDALLAYPRLELVKVLDLEGCTWLEKRQLKNICDKVFQLKYLSLRNTEVAELPREINTLRYMETFDIRGTKLESFPAKQIMLHRLLHLLAGRGKDDDDDSFFFAMPRGIGNMTGVQTLSHVRIDKTADGDLESVGHLHQLRKLGVVIDGDQRVLGLLLRVVGRLNEALRSLSVRIVHQQDDAAAALDMDAAPADMTIAPPLESLAINGRIRGLPAWIKALHQLSKITLCRTALTEKDVHALGKLLSLRSLRLRRQSYEPKKKQLTLKEFRALEFLLIDGLDISCVQFDKGAAPLLEKMVWSLVLVPVTTSPAAKAAALECPGVQNLQFLREVEINGSCDTSQVSKAMEANPKHPVLKHNKPDFSTSVVP